MILQLSKHKDTHAWGRNGSFIPATAYVNGWDAGPCFDKPYVSIGIESSRPGRTTPISLRLSVADARKLKQALSVAIREAK